MLFYERIMVLVIFISDLKIKNLLNIILLLIADENNKLIEHFFSIVIHPSNISINNFSVFNRLSSDTLDIDLKIKYKLTETWIIKFT